MKIESGAVVCQEAEVIGDVSIGSGTVVHTRARIVASRSGTSSGSVIFGPENIIEEKALLQSSEAPLVIGAGNVFQVGCRVDSSILGDGNIIECRAVVGAGSRLGNGCVIGVGVVLPPGSVVPDDTIITADGTRHVVPGSMEVSYCYCNRYSGSSRQSNISLASKQGDVLRKTLPKYNRICPTLES